MLSPDMTDMIPFEAVEGRSEIMNDLHTEEERGKGTTGNRKRSVDAIEGRSEIMKDLQTEGKGGNGPPGNGNGPENGLAGQEHIAGKVLIVLVLLVVLLVGLSYWLGDGLGDVKVSPGYLILALVGVIFHIASKHREMLDVGGFSWKEYGADYLFRAFQACVYVILIQNLVDSDGQGGSVISWNMSLVSLFVGMYIRKVEKTFESLGDRFGDMLSGLLGTAVQQLSPAERRKKLEELQQQFLDLKNKYSQKKANLDQTDQRELDAQFLKVKELLQKGKRDAVEMEFLNLEFRFKELGVA